MYNSFSSSINILLSFSISYILFLFCFFFFNDTATPEISPLSLHDALPISAQSPAVGSLARVRMGTGVGEPVAVRGPAAQEAALRGGLGGHRRSDSDLDAVAFAIRTDRKSTRLNSSHLGISYAVFCLEKKRKTRGHLHLGRSQAHLGLVMKENLRSLGPSEWRTLDCKLLCTRLDVCDAPKTEAECNV